MNINYKLISDEIKKLNKTVCNQVSADTEGKKFTFLMLKKLSGYRGEKLLSAFTDGGGDHNIDAVYFYEGDNEFVINIMTCIFKSNSDSTFSDKDITDFINNGVKYLVFGGDEAEDLNEKLKAIKEEIDEQKQAYGNNFSVNLRFVSSGDSVLTSTSKEMLSKFQNEVNSSGSDLSFEEVDGQNIAALFSSRQILKIAIPIKLSGKSYYLLTGKEGFICRLPVAEIVKAYFGFEENSKKYKGYGDFLFTDNIRKDLGVERKINQKIYNTATSDKEITNFEHYNNGITIIYDEMSGAVSGDSPTIFIKGIQVVNGCQTVNTLLKAHKEKKLHDDLYLTCRFIKRTTDTNFIQSVITYTNSQNAITDRDLHSNDPIQYNIQTILEKFKIKYERKLNEFKGSFESWAKIDALDSAQAFLCCDMRKPHRAKQDKRHIFGKSYSEIFKPNRGDLAHRLFLSFLVLEEVLKKQSEHRSRKRKTKLAGNTPRYSISDLVVSHGSYHIAAKLYQKYFDATKEIDDLEKNVRSKKTPNTFDKDYKEILGEISGFMETEKIEKEEFARYFKNNALMT